MACLTAALHDRIGHRFLVRSWRLLRFPSPHEGRRELDVADLAVSVRMSSCSSVSFISKRCSACRSSGSSMVPLPSLSTAGQRTCTACEQSASPCGAATGITWFWPMRTCVESGHTCHGHAVQRALCARFLQHTRARPALAECVLAKAGLLRRGSRADHSQSLENPAPMCR